jgi:hypothetical protein
MQIEASACVGTLAMNNSGVYLNEKEAYQMDSLRDNWVGHWQKLLDVYVANGSPARADRPSILYQLA